MDFIDEPGETPFNFMRSEAFRCIEGTHPVPLPENTGCRWAIHAKPHINIGVEPSTILQCGQPRVMIGDKILPYCDHHCRMSYREWDEHKKRLRYAQIKNRRRTAKK